MDEYLFKVLTNLKKTGKFRPILEKIENSARLPMPYIFEALFANALESNGVSLAHEVNLSSDNDSTLDFIQVSNNKNQLCFELVSPEMSDELKAQCEPNSDGIWEVLLHGDHGNKYFRPEAQTIRMQEKILEKVRKFPEPSNHIFSLIVVDCTNFHSGHVDDDDCRMVMWGKTFNPFFQEKWEGQRLQGLLEESNRRRGTDEFRRRITGVIFVLKIPFELLDGAWMVLNNLRSKDHLQMFYQEIKDKRAFSGVRIVHMPIVRLSP